MRWFVALLLVANVILYFWVQQQSGPLHGSSQLPPPDIGELRLANEAERRPELTADAVYQGAAQGTLAGAPDAAPVVQTPTVPPANRAAGATPVPLPPAVAEVSPAQAATNANSEPAPSAVAAQATDGAVAVPRQAQSAQVRPEIAQTPAGEAAAPAGVQPSCARVGPFAADEADKLIAGLPVYVRLLADVVEGQPKVEGYYVLIPPLPSQAAGIQKMKELADAGVEDTWLFRSGDQRNAISLGFFKFEASAKQRAEDIAKKGFEVEFREKVSPQQRRWLHLKDVNGGDLRGSLALPDNVVVEQQACP